MDTPIPSGLIVSVLRPAGFPDCTLRGISSRYNDLTLLLDEGGPFLPMPDRPAVKLVKRSFSDYKGLHDGGGRHTYLHVVPVFEGSDDVAWMFGGNFISTSDSRFPGYYPIPIHDRREQ